MFVKKKKKKQMQYVLLKGLHNNSWPSAVTELS